MMKFRQRAGKTWFAYAFVFAFAWPLFADDFVRYVDPFVGTSGTGHTTPVKSDFHSAAFFVDFNK